MDEVKSTENGENIKNGQKGYLRKTSKDDRSILLIAIVRGHISFIYVFPLHWPSSAQQTTSFCLLFLQEALPFQPFSAKHWGEVLLISFWLQLWVSYKNPPSFLHVPLPPLYVIDEDSRVYVYKHECWIWQS